MTEAASSQDQEGARGKPIVGRRALDSLSFEQRTTGEAAKARSRLVRRMRLILPASGVVLVAVLLFNTRSNENPDAFLDDFKDFNASPEELRVASPRFDGIDDKGDPFEITAASAKQRPESPDFIELENPSARQGANDRTTVVVAQKGLYDRDKNVLDLSDGVELEHEFADEKYLLKLPAATVSIDEAKVESNGAVSGEGSDGANLEADHMTAYRTDSRVVFEGNVRMRIYPKSAKKLNDDEKSAAQ